MARRYSPSFMDDAVRLVRLQARRTRRWRGASRSRPGAPVFANWCQTPKGARDFSADNPAVSMVNDITIVHTDEDWRYLATVIALAIRAVIGWSEATHMRATLMI